MLKSFLPRNLAVSLFAVGVVLCGAADYANADFQKGLHAYDKGDYRTAYAEWIDDAENGDLAAQRNIGNLYRWGKGTEQNPSRAAYWYYRAAKAGFDRAQFNLAMLYFRGEGVPKDELEAIRWLDKAKKQGNKDAEKILSWLKIEENKAALNVVLNSLEDDDPSFVKEYEAAMQTEDTKDEPVSVAAIPQPVEKATKPDEPTPIKQAVVTTERKVKTASIQDRIARAAKARPVIVKAEPKVEAKAVKVHKEPDSVKIAAVKVPEKEEKPKPAEKPVVKAKPQPKPEPKKIKIAAVKTPVKSEPAIKPISYYKKKGILKAHLGSYSEETGATKDWKTFLGKSEYMQKLDKMVVRVDLGKKGVWHRLYAIGDGHDIESLCEDFRSKKSYCLLTRKSL